MKTQSKKNQQLEIFNPFGSAEIHCFSCTKILPQNTEKVAEKHLCASCLKAYTSSLEVSYTQVRSDSST